VFALQAIERFLSWLAVYIQHNETPARGETHIAGLATEQPDEAVGV
jgi:hypothetical protein